jgi:hypothetical protein
MARGVNLEALRDKKKFQHRWVVVGNFVVNEKDVAKLAEARLAAEAQRDRGEIPDPINVQLDLGTDKLIGVDGPGCPKCGLHWSAPDGWGKLCRVSDDQMPGQMEVRTPPPVPHDGSAPTSRDEGAWALLDEEGGVDRELPGVEDMPEVAMAMAGEPTVIHEEEPSFEPQVYEAEKGLKVVDKRRNR